MAATTMVVGTKMVMVVMVTEMTVVKMVCWVRNGMTEMMVTWWGREGRVTNQRAQKEAVFSSRFQA